MTDETRPIRQISGNLEEFQAVPSEVRYVTGKVVICGRLSGQWARGCFTTRASVPNPLKSGGVCYGNKPKTATLVGVPTYTRPFATIGVMNLLSAKWSRALLA
jgi:hypothetical protein